MLIKEEEFIKRGKGSSLLFRISGLTGTEGEDEWFDLSYLILNEASDPPKYDNVPADREELVGDVLSFTLLFPFELQLCISELELTLRGHKPLYAHIIELREL